MSIAFRRRLLLALAPLLALALLDINPAHAAIIVSGQTKTGTITGTNHDDYTFTVTEGSSFVIAVAETGNHDARFTPEIDLVPPGNAPGTGVGTSLHTRLLENNAAGGSWTVKVSRADDSDAGGAYALKLIQIPGAIGTLMIAGQNYSGSNTRGAIDVYTFAGIAGHTASLTLTKTAGAGFLPEIFVYSPTGVFAGGVNCAASCGQDFPLAADGTYTVLAWRADINDVAGTYKLALTDKN